MTAASSGGGDGGGLSPPTRAMKREFAFALQSLSEITASPGRTRSGRSISSPAPSPQPKRRRTRSDLPIMGLDADGKGSDPADLVSPPTPPLDAEAPKAIREADLTLNAEAPKVIREAGLTLNDEALKVSPHADIDIVKANHDTHQLMDAEATISNHDVCAAQTEEGVESNTAITPQHLSDGSNAPVEVADIITQPAQSDDQPAKQDIGVGLIAAVCAIPDTSTTQERSGLELDVQPTLEGSTVMIGNHEDMLMDASYGSIGSNILDIVLTDPPVVVNDPTTPASTVDLKHARRFTRSLLKSNPDDEATPSENQGGEDKKNTSVDLALSSEKPERRFTRSLLKPKVEAACPTSNSIGSDQPINSVSHSPSSVKKMEMKMSKKVACLKKHPGNIRELFNTGLLEGMPVMYIIPHSKRNVLKGVITGSNICCFCLSCNGSKAVCAYFFEQHAGSNKKHPADYIYLGNGNSLRDVLRASQSSPFESLEKTIRSSIDPMVMSSHTNCLNCNGDLHSSQTEHFLCHYCLQSKLPQDPPSLSHTYNKCNSSLTPSSKGSFLKKISSSKKGGSSGKVTTKDTGLHKLVFKVLLDGTEVAYYVDGQRKVDGYIKDQRIYCNHCNKVVSPSAFEAHAGEGSRRKPYDNIFTSNGVSLHELSMKISKDMELSERETDDLCRECGQGGDIFPCKMCPRSVHPACIGLSEVPLEWFCDNCSNLVQKEKALAANKNAKAAGRQDGVDSFKQIFTRAIRTVPISDDLGGCAICKQKDFNNAVFDERTVILCDQCEKEYHVGCLRNQWEVDLKELPEGEWFCCSSCSEIRSSLDKIIADGAQILLDSDIDIIRKKHESRGLSLDTNTDIRWQLLAGRNASGDSTSLLSAAVPVIYESFDPITEAHTGRDLIPEMVHGRRPKDGMPGQDYSGMYCAVLTLGSTVVSAALLRVMGGEVAELPLVATSVELQGLGYFQVLFSCMERMLISLKIKHLMLPAAGEAEAIWMTKFGFTKIPHDQLEAHLNGAHPTVFFGTSNLYKAVHN